MIFSCVWIYGHLYDLLTKNKQLGSKQSAPHSLFAQRNRNVHNFLLRFAARSCLETRSWALRPPLQSFAALTVRCKMRCWLDRHGPDVPSELFLAASASSTAEHPLPRSWALPQALLLVKIPCLGSVIEVVLPQWKQQQTTHW